MLRPCAADVIEMLLNQPACLSHLPGLETVVGLELDDRFNPELCLPVRVLDMHVRSPFFA
jgi:hypothetical protein